MLLALYETMQLIRHIERRPSALVAGGEVPGSLYLSVGQEAAPAGVSSALRRDDIIASN